ncbi:uroporphyrinogen-III synthase [Luteococcus japonicus]|uniref:Uroporphyrinogen-III methyltransferase / Uroporphyrinogen-III synthase n=1 Tax=Luteococcus japonicus LSP_Lj1 TaxID=1255658 RepID=A0A1R4IDX3_9ACTN|nr:uroporphyrinogen-III synthase [Luteococcus japonicus]SJN18061.1 Uroporphyrinogen-III methyltransferase / Uroporphyrinogen-III synthase [Luteococcus japonicus LSP_Lj1]
MNNDDLAPGIAPGRVLFVGAGPGDPNLLTLAALGALEEAGAVLVDSDELRRLLDHHQVTVDPEATIASFASTEQAPEAPLEARVRAIRTAAASGAHVVRLVAGDPFLDGRVSREASACVQAGLDIEIVPGISAMTAIPEYAGVALDRGGVHLINVVPSTGDASELGSAHLWANHGTLVVHATAAQLVDVHQHAVASGRANDEPVLLTFSGGSTQQNSRQAKLGDLPRVARTLDPEAGIHVMIGTAVEDSPRDELDWFESKPLFGWRVLVPRTKDQAGEMVARLEMYGAHADEVPTISVEPPRTPQQMDKAVRGLVEGSYEWVAFTSVNAVKAVCERLEEYGLDARAFSGLRIAAVGNATAKALRAWGIVPDLVPVHEHSAAGLAAEFPAYDEVLDPINRVFLPRADIATEVLVAGLVELGWEVDDVTAYRTVRAAPPPAETREAIKTGKFDAAVFTSSSTVRNLVGIAGKPHSHTVIAAIGPQTSTACTEHGLRVDVVAPQPGALELVDALAAFAVERRAELLAEGRPVTKPSETRRRRKVVTA